MIDRYLLRIVVVLSFLLGLFSPGLEAQEREEVYPKELLNVIMRGAGDPPALPSLDASYCSDDGPIDIYVEETLPTNVTTIQWTVQFNMGGTLVAVSDYHESIGSFPNLGIRLFPDRFSEEHLNRSILISYNIVSGSGASGKGDYTHVLKKPTVYNLSIDGFEAEVDGEICIGESVTLILDGSEVGVNYFLQRDGVNINPFPQEGTGGALSWTNISVGGEYSVLAVNSRSFHFGPDVTHSYQCSSVMNETPFLTVHPIPVPTVNSDKAAYCVGEPIQLSGGPDGMASYSWTYPDGAIAEERNPLIASADYSSHNGTYTLTVESADGCINSTTLNVVVNENPTATLPTDFDVCEDAPLNFTTTVTGGAGPYSYAWTKDGNPIGTTTASISVPSASLGDAGVYEVTVTDANGCGAATASISIGVNESPVIGAVSIDGPACEGESIQLSASGVTGVGTLSYAWTGPNGFSSSDENPLIDPVTLADVGAYTLVVSDESGCSSDPATTTVVVDALPEATLSGDAAVCVGATGSYTAGGGDQYTFTVLDASNTTVESHGPSASNTFETSALAVGSYTIQVLVENAAGCTAEESVTLTVNAAPEATIAFDPAVICEGESSELVVELTTGAAPWSLNYHDGSGLVSRGGITGLTHREEVNHTSKVTYTLLSITANGCTVNSNTTATLTVNERPKVSVESDNDPSNEVCLGGTMVLIATATDGVGPYGYQWYFEENPIIGATASTYTISNAEAADAGAYSVVVSSSNAGVTCDSDPAILTVTVVEVTAALDGAAGYCFGGTETYTASGGDSYTFTLYDAGNNVIATQAASANDSYTTPAALAAGDYTLEVVVANALGCDDIATLPFTIYPEPAASISFSESVVCEGDNTTLEIELTSGSTPWSVTYNNGLGDQTVNGITETTFSLEFSPAGDVTYTLVSITDANGCTATPGTTAEVTVNEVPTVTLLSDNDPSNLVCLGNDMLLTATASGGAGNYVYQWTHNGVVLPGATGATYTISNAEADDAGEYSVVVTDTDNGHACESAPASLTVDVTEADALPTVFKLSGDDFYCGPGGQTILTLSGSQSDVEYTLYRDDVPGATQSGNGGLLKFIVNQEGKYWVEAVYKHEYTSCPLPMNGIIQVEERALPDLTKRVNVDDSGADCTTGAEVTLLASEPDVEYEIYWWTDDDNNGPTGRVASGDGSDLVFSAAIIDGGGSYRVRAIKNGCPKFLDQIFTVDIPNVLEKFNITGEGTVCEGDGGVVVGLSGSEADVTYSLLDRDLGSVVGSPINTAELDGYTAGDALSFGIIEEAGNYIVEAVSNDGTCSLKMNGVFELRFNPLPEAFRLTGSGAFCDEGVGAAIGLDDSENGVLYTLIWDNAGVPRTRGTAPGSGEALFFEGVSDEGNYTVYARNDFGCTSSMNGTVEVVQKSAPSTSLTLKANDYCAASVSGELTVEGHEDGVYYHLYSPDASGSWIQTLVGTGRTEDLLLFEGLQEDNLYTLYASWEAEACWVEVETGIEVSLLDSPEVPVLDPIVESPSCAGQAYISVTNGQENLVYYLINTEDASQAEDAYALSGLPIEWDQAFMNNHPELQEVFLQVVAVNEATGCRVGSDFFRIEVLDAPGDFELESDGTAVTQDVPLVKCSNSPFDLRIPVSEDGVLYRLYRHSASGGVDRLATLEGNGAEISFSSVTQWPEGDYYVEATFASSGCVGSVAEFTIQLLYSPHHFVPLVLNYTDGLLVVEEKVVNATYTLYFNGEAHPLAPIQVNVLTDEVAWEVGESGTYYVTAQSPAGCIDESNTITISDVTPPVDEYSLVDPVLEYCSGDAGGIDVVLTGTTAGVYYELVKLDDHDNPEVIQIKKGITDGGSLVFNGVEGTHTYSIWVDGSDEDFFDKTFEVTENPTPSSFLLSRGGAVNSHEITLFGSEKDVWYWLFRNGNFDSEEMPLVGTDSILNFGTVNKPGDYSVIAFGEGGCEAEMEGMANIYQSELVAVNDTLYLSPDDLAGTLDLAENDRFSFIGGLDRYSTAGDGNLMFRIVRPAKSGAETSLNEFSGMLSYSKLPSFYGEDFLEYRIENLEVPGRESGIGRVVIMVGNKDFNENQSFLLPNAFSPNDDGINDRFVISGLGETEESTLEVFNRWGTIVYRSQGKQYDNSWDGTSNVGAMVSIGKELPNGVYFYVYSVKKNVNGSIQTRNYSGYVELRR